jgi:dUTP pyrophosphatase
MDLYACEEGVVPPLSSISPDCLHSMRFLIRTGLSFSFPVGYGMFIWDRSSLAARFGLHCLAGVIDPGYRGEVMVALVNLGQTTYTVNKGDRIAQAVISPIALPELREVRDLPTTTRDSGGFGSTGA